MEHLTAKEIHNGARHGRINSQQRQKKFTTEHATAKEIHVQRSNNKFVTEHVTVSNINSQWTNVRSPNKKKPSTLGDDDVGDDESLTNLSHTNKII